VAAVFVFYASPLFSPRASIQWDAVDVHYCAQKYFSDALRSGKLPQWTSHIFSGFPFLADPQTGEWYPVHMPWLLAGITPRAIEWQLALHCLIALFGVYLLAGEYTKRREAALLAALAYGFSGYFADHSSHLGMFETAALLPWLLFLLRRSLATGEVAWMAAAGLVMGFMAQIGHFQNALYAGFAALLFCIATVAADGGGARRAALSLVIAVVIGVLVGAVLIVPGLELARESIRAGMDFSKQADAVIGPRAVATLVWPDAMGAFEVGKPGSAPVEQHYFYSGLLLLPLAVLGLRRRARLLAPAAALVVLPLWYGLGPAAGFYRVVSWVPGFARIRAPAHIWFVIALGLALFAGAGFDIVLDRWTQPWLALGVLLLLFADLYYWNSAVNPLAYARTSFQQAYGKGEKLFETRIAANQPKLTRFYAPYASATFGPLNDPLLSHAETTYGYNPLELRRYHYYLDVAKQNPKLLNSLGASRILDPRAAALKPNPAALPRAFFPRRVIGASSEADVLRRLETLDPAAEAVAVLDDPPRQDSGATTEIVEYAEDAYSIRCHAARPSLLRLAVPYYPGWRVTVDGANAGLLVVDYALMGVVVPAGDHEVRFDFRLNHFVPAFVVSELTLLAVVMLLVKRRRRLR